MNTSSIFSKYNSTVVPFRLSVPLQIQQLTVSCIDTQRNRRQLGSILSIWLRGQDDSVRAAQCCEDLRGCGIYSTFLGFFSYSASQVTKKVPKKSQKKLKNYNFGGYILAPKVFYLGLFKYDIDDV